MTAALASERARQLTTLTEDLTDRMITEIRAFEARKPQDAVGSIAETQEMANLYRRESARVKADPSLIAGATLSERNALMRATEAFDAVLARYARAVEAARVVSEGVVKAIAAEVAAARGSGAGYGASGYASAGDASAVALNRRA